MRSSLLSCLGGCLLLVACLAVGGCKAGKKPPKAQGQTVSGSVTMSKDGKQAPLPIGFVQFYTDEGVVAQAAIGNGSYTMKDVPEGPVRVAVTFNQMQVMMGKMAMAAREEGKAPPPGAQMPFHMMRGQKGEGGAGGKGATLIDLRMLPEELQARMQMIDRKYANPEESKLTYTVTSAPEQTYNIPLD